MYTLKADDFRLEMVPFVYLENDPFMDLTVRVTSHEFFGHAVMEPVYVWQLAAFARDTMALYETLAGSAKLEDSGTNSSIEFRAGKMGHILVSGVLNNWNNEHLKKQSLHFENEFDQTWLQPFAKKLFADWKKYLKEENA